MQSMEKNNITAKMLIIEGSEHSSWIKSRLSLSIGVLETPTYDFVAISITHFQTSLQPLWKCFVAIPSSVKAPHVYRSCMYSTKGRNANCNSCRKSWFWWNRKDKSSFSLATKFRNDSLDTRSLLHITGGGKGIHLFRKKEKVVVDFWRRIWQTIVLGSLYHGGAKSGKGWWWQLSKSLMTKNGNSLILDDKTRCFGDY